MLNLAPDWMNWTLPTLIFLGTIISLLVGFTVWDMKDPGWAREGYLLPIATTRGDRFFMGLLITGCIFCLWLTFFGTRPPGASLPSVPSLLSSQSIFSERRLPRSPPPSGMGCTPRQGEQAWEKQPTPRYANCLVRIMQRNFGKMESFSWRITLSMKKSASYTLL
jgi:predicted small integral membrane protein